MLIVKPHATRAEVAEVDRLPGRYRDAHAARLLMRRTSLLASGNQSLNLPTAESVRGGCRPAGRTGFEWAAQR
jgi:hypothetical protein